MKHFLLQATHGAAFGKRSPEALAAYSRFLQEGHDEGHFLLSGLTIQSEGAILIARAESLKRLSDLKPRISYSNGDVVQFDRITEFAPIQHQFILNHWFEKYSVRGVPRECERWWTSQQIRHQMGNWRNEG